MGRKERRMEREEEEADIGGRPRFFLPLFFFFLCWLLLLLFLLFLLFPLSLGPFVYSARVGNFLCSIIVRIQKKARAL